jgi:hypothetical protein
MAKHRTPPSQRKAKERAEEKAQRKATRQAESSTTPTVTLEDFIDRAANDPLWIGDPIWAVRGHAIQAWGNVEQSLCALFRHLTGMPMAEAALVFFKVINTGTRDSLLKALLRKKYGNTYKAFWGSLQRLLKPLSDKRNSIVHWNVTRRGFSGVPCCALIPPADLWGPGGEHARLTTEDLFDFYSRCMFIFHVCDMFWRVLDPDEAKRLDPAKAAAWRDIFLQPVSYPPKRSHPLYQMMQGAESPPPPSQE